MSYYVFEPTLSYQEYLQKRDFIRIEEDGIVNIVLEMSRRMLDLIADENSLKLHRLTILAPKSDAPGQYVQLCYEAAAASEELQDMPASFHWGLADRLARMGHMNEKLGDLVQKLDSPEQILAFNHFQKAREAFDRREFHVALDEIDKAVYGDQASAGFRSEWRFFHLQGVIHLGCYDCCPDTIDLKKAEESFVQAAKLSQATFPSNSSLAWLAASWAAYCQGHLLEATGYAQKSVESNLRQIESYFLLAKYQVAAGLIDEAIQNLMQAVNRDTFYALKAAADGDFQAHEEQVMANLVRLKHEKYETFKTRILADINLSEGQQIPKEIEGVIARFSQERSLLEISKSEREWNEFKVRPVFHSKDLGATTIDHESLVKIVEPYREKVVVKEATLFRKEESKIITKNRTVERLKKIRYDIRSFRDMFMFFTGKVLAEFDLVLVEGGKFQMGDVNSIGRIDEKPLQEVTVSSYLMSAILVTQKVWNLAMDFNPSNFQGYELPVEHISWYDSIEFCNRLSLMAGFRPCYAIDKNKQDPLNINKTDNLKWAVECDWTADGYRLPTEAEWEFAARGGNNTNFYRFSGSETANQVCWHKDNSGYKTQIVAQKKSNELGLYDLSGNVWEWCWDWYDRYQVKELTDPHGPVSGSYRVIRGGSWADNLNYHRPAGRGKENPTGRYTSIGLRIVRNYVQPQ